MKEGTREARAADVPAVERRGVHVLEGSTSLIRPSGRSIAHRDDDLVVISGRELRLRIRRGIARWMLPFAALALAAAIFVGVTVRDRARGPERLGDLYFPAFGVLKPGSTAYYNPGDINPTERNSAWRILEAQTWTRIGCRNAAVQGRGPGHDLTLTVLKGASPLALAPTMFGCRIVGSAEPYATCDATGSLVLQEGEWVTLRSDTGPEIENDAQVYCEVQRHGGGTINAQPLRRAVVQ